MRQFHDDDVADNDYEVDVDGFDGDDDGDDNSTCW